jgi:hypothetical protein
MANLKVPRQLMMYFGDDREIQRFFQQLENLLSQVGTTSLDDVSQQHGSSADTKVGELEKAINELRKAVHTPSNFEVIKRLDDIEKRLH